MANKFEIVEFDDTLDIVYSKHADSLPLINPTLQNKPCLDPRFISNIAGKPDLERLRSTPALRSTSIFYPLEIGKRAKCSSSGYDSRYRPLGYRPSMYDLQNWNEVR